MTLAKILPGNNINTNWVIVPNPMMKMLRNVFQKSSLTDAGFFNQYMKIYLNGFNIISFYLNSTFLKKSKEIRRLKSSKHIEKWIDLDYF